jgi:hypothetical protein
VIRQKQTSTKRGLISGGALAIRLGVAGIVSFASALLGTQKSAFANDGLNQADAGWSAKLPIEAQAFIAVRGGQAFKSATTPRMSNFPTERRRPMPAADIQSDDQLKSA